MRKYFIYLLLMIFLYGCAKNETPSSGTIVGIIPYKGISAQKVNQLKYAIKNYYGVSVIVLPQQVLPKAAFIAVKSPRYRADSLIIFQQRGLNNMGIDYVMGVTEHDISVTKHNKNGTIKTPKWRYNDFGVMGLAYCPGISCIASGFRLKTMISLCILPGLKKWLFTNLDIILGCRTARIKNA